MKQAYKEARNFNAASLKLIDTMDTIVTEYDRQGLKMTVRQLYYQLVAREIIPNTIQSYNRVQGLLTEARLCGLIDWDAIEDRTRGFIERSHWESGRSILDACASSFHMDLWETQENRVFVIVEKEALAGVLERTCREFDVPLLPARGYPSVTSLREMAQDRMINCSQNIIILHLGDHDPSGIDMTRDLTDRLDMLTGGIYFELQRIALTMDQVDELKPPPNPAKTTDSRFSEYRRMFGTESWELDALPPDYLHRLLSRHIMHWVDDDAWSEREAHIMSVKENLRYVALNFKE